MLDSLHCKGCWELFDSWWNSMDPTERRRWMGRFSSSVFSEDDLYHLSGYEWNELSSKEQTKIFGLREIARDGYFKKQLQLNTPMLSIFGLVTMLGPLFYFYFRRGR